MKEEIEQLEKQLGEIFTKSKEMLVSYMDSHNLTKVDLCTDFKGVPMFDTDTEDVVDEFEYYNNRIYVTAYDGEYVTTSAVVTSVELADSDYGYTVIALTADDEHTTYDSDNIEVDASLYLELLRWLIERFGE